MKWGVRRFQNKDGSLTPAGKKRVRDMSDDELRAQIARKKLENEYKELRRGSLSRALTTLGSKYIDYRENKEKRADEKESRQLESEKARAEVFKARYGYKTAVQNAKQAASKASEATAKKDLYAKELIQEKAMSTVRGAFRAKIAKVLSKDRSVITYFSGAKRNERKKLKLERLNMDLKISELEGLTPQEKARQEQARAKRGRVHMPGI
jgi:hypothetical protein